jgi:probable lipoprotein NlpC
MNKYISLTLFLVLIYSFSLSSCSTLRKEPNKSSATNNKSRNTPSRSNSSYSATSRGPVKKTVTKATPAKRPAVANASKPSYTRPAGSYNAEIPKVVEVARTYSGTPYRSGGNDKNGIDCSGLICSVYSEIGVKVPRISWQQSEFGSEVNSIAEIQPGDWVFFVPEAGKEGYVSHAGIVTDVRNGDEIIFIHASTSRGVREDNLFSTYFKGRFVKAMRPFKL